MRKPVPFAKLVEKYKEFAGGYKRGWETEKYIVEGFGSLFGDTPLAQITTWQIEKWKAEAGKRLNPVTVNRLLTVIKYMFKKALEWDLVKSNPATSVKRFAVTSERTRLLTEYEIHVLLEKCENQGTSPWLLPLVAGLKHGDEARRAAKAQMGELGLGARGDNNHTEQDPVAKDHCHQRASATSVKLA